MDKFILTLSKTQDNILYICEMHQSLSPFQNFQTVFYILLCKKLETVFYMVSSQKYIIRNYNIHFLYNL